MNPLDHIVGAASKDCLYLQGLDSASAAYMVGALCRTYPEHRVVTLVPSEEDARKWILDAQNFISTKVEGAPATLHVPSIDVSPYIDVSSDNAQRQQRIGAYTQLVNTKSAPQNIVVSMPSLMRRCLPRQHIAKLSFDITKGQSLDRDTLVRQLVSAGYNRISVVDDVGTFAVRGDVLDVFSPLYQFPIRIEFFGDDIETLRFFDSSTQRTLRQTDQAFFPPARETILSSDHDQRSQILTICDDAGQPSTETRKLLDQVDMGDEFIGIDSLLPSFHQQLDPLIDYLKTDRTIWLVLDLHRCKRMVKEEWDDANARYVERLADHKAAFPPPRFFVDPDDIEKCLSPVKGIICQELQVADESKAQVLDIRRHTELTQRLDSRRHQKSDEPVRPLLEALNDWKDQGRRVAILCQDTLRKNKITALLDHHKQGYHQEKKNLALFDSSASTTPMVVEGFCSGGFDWPEAGICVLSDQDIFGGRKIKKRAKKHTRKSAKQALLGDVSDFSVLEVGNLLVHQLHGVGRYEGLAKLPIGNSSVDFLHVEYQGGTLYVPVYRLSEVQRYIGSDGVNPKLDKLGGITFAKSKSRAQKDIQALAEELLKLYAERAALPGHKYPPPDAMFNDFEASFEFEETPDQAAAIDDVISDMESERPMDRLICGDVGYGKTEVALRAAFKAALGGKQVAFLAPTTVLVEQHYQTMSKRFAKWPVTVARMSRFQTKKDLTKTVTALAEGNVDIVVGTHRLLSKDVRFKDLGLVIIDEEQRFGVTHKERLKKMRTQVDVLTLTATPIPRTLNLAMTGLRDLSIIATPPADRRSIRTLIARPEDPTLREGIRREIARGGQIYFVTPRILSSGTSLSIEDWAKRLRDVSPGINVVVAHGQMSAGQLEKAMLAFVKGDAQILVSTTIIESGLDIASANTMFIASADRFGLSQLYQLRGRIGRSSKRAYCYLMVPTMENLNDVARKRLATLQRHSDLGAGFKIASQDLEIRGAGDLLGAKQSGSIAAIGFNAYTEMLNEAVAELKGEPIAPEKDPELHIEIPSYIPDHYIEDVRQRLSFYKRLSSATTTEELDDLKEELDDRYGPLPDETLRLVEVMVLKNIAKSMNALRLDLSDTHVTVALSQETTLDPKHVMTFVSKNGSQYRLTPDLRLSYRFSEEEQKNQTIAAQQALKVLR